MHGHGAAEDIELRLLTLFCAISRQDCCRVSKFSVPHEFVNFRRKRQCLAALFITIVGSILSFIGEEVMSVT